MDNANTLIQVRFGIEYSKTGQYLCIPFLSASTQFHNLVFSTMIFGYLLKKFSRRRLAFLSGLIGVFAHLMIYWLPNSNLPTDHNMMLVALAFFAFGFGLGSYYSIIYPLVGLSVKK
jgi:MFS family permease